VAAVAVLAAVAAAEEAAPRRRLRRLAARSRARVAHRCWRSALVPCSWLEGFWHAGSFGK
jgi:hypothetical protein